MHVAVAPFFARFKRPNHRVSGIMKMLGGVLVLRRIAAANMTAFKANAQVNPLVARLLTFLTALSIGCHILMLEVVIAGLHRLFILTLNVRQILLYGSKAAARSRASVPVLSAVQLYPDAA